MSNIIITGVHTTTSPYTKKPKCRVCLKEIIKGEETVSICYISGKWEHIGHYHPQCSEKILTEAVEQASKVFQQAVQTLQKVESIVKNLPLSVTVE